MDRKRNILKGLLLVGMISCALPAAAVSYHSTHQVSRSNLAGTSFVVLPSFANHFCYLSKVGVQETDTHNEYAICQVHRSGRSWILRASLGRNLDADVTCAAVCYNN